MMNPVKQPWLDDAGDNLWMPARRIEFITQFCLEEFG
jgi:hypothetical protein